MICETCQGHGIAIGLGEIGQGGCFIPCPACGGSGIVHCCEGERAHPPQPSTDKQEGKTS